MLLKYFNSNRISVIVIFLLLPVLYWIPSLVQGATEPLSVIKGMPFGKWVTAFNENFRVLASLIALLLIILNGYLLIQLNTVHIFIPIRTQLPLFFYIILSISLIGMQHLTPALVSSTLMILVFYRIFSAYKVDGISINFLDAGLLIATASLFYFPAILFFVCLLVALLLLRPFVWREWLFAFIGLLLPYTFVISGFYLLDIPVKNLFTGMADSFAKVPKNLNLSQIISWSYVLLFTLIASYYMTKAIDSMKIHARKYFLVFLAFFLVSVIVFFAVSGSGTGMVYYAALPLGYLFSYYFVRCNRNWINDIFFGLFLILLIWQRIG